MNILIEILMEFILEGSLEICKSKKVNIFLRILALLILVLFFGGFFSLFTLLGINCLKNNLLGGIFILFVDLSLLIIGATKVYRYYKDHNTKQKSE